MDSFEKLMHQYFELEMKKIEKNFYDKLYCLSNSEVKLDKGWTYLGSRFSIDNFSIITMNHCSNLEGIFKKDNEGLAFLCHRCNSYLYLYDWELFALKLAEK